MLGECHPWSVELGRNQHHGVDPGFDAILDPARGPDHQPFGGQGSLQPGDRSPRLLQTWLEARRQLGEYVSIPELDQGRDLLGDVAWVGFDDPPLERARMGLFEVLALCGRVATKGRVDKIEHVRVVAQQGSLHISDAVAA